MGASILAALIGAGASYGLSQMNQPDTPDIQMPEAPQEEDAVAKAEEQKRARLSAQKRGATTIFTDPLGIAGAAKVNKKTVLGA